MMMRDMMMGASVVAMGALVACDSSSTPSGTSAALSATQLQQAVANDGASEVELQLVDGAAREAHVRAIGNDEHLEGYVLSVDDVAGTVELDDIGVVTYGDGTRFRTDRESHASRAEWLGGVQPGTFVRASRPTPSEPQAPSDTTFFATDLRIEDGDGRSKIEMSIDGDNLLTDPPTLLVLGGAFDLSTLRTSDDGTDDQGGGNEDDGPGDDNGGHGNEPGDDNGGNGQAEPGDDNGGGGNEPGDDNGGHGGDDGADDHGGHGNDD